MSSSLKVMEVKVTVEIADGTNPSSPVGYAFGVAATRCPPQSGSQVILK
jgi:hypothetical protein